jgi:hypothetical protein
LHESAVESRFEALRGPALTRLVGRDEEINLLLRRWARAKTGDGQVVVVSGEPASANRASPRHWRSASTPWHISACAISARPPGQRAVSIYPTRPGGEVRFGRRWPYIA